MHVLYTLYRYALHGTHICNKENVVAMKDDIFDAASPTQYQEGKIVITYNPEDDELTYNGPASYNKKQIVQLKQLVRQGLITPETEKYSQKKQRKCPHSKGKRGAAELSQLVLHRVSPTVETMKELLPDMMDAVYYQDEARLKIAGKWQTIPRGWPDDIRLVPPGNYIYGGDGQKRKTRLADLKPMYDFLRKELLKKQNIPYQIEAITIDHKTNMSKTTFKSETDTIDNSANDIIDMLNRKRRIDVGSVTSAEPEDKRARLTSGNGSPVSPNRPCVNIIPKTINKFEEGKELDESKNKLPSLSRACLFPAQSQHMSSSYIYSLPKTVRMFDDASDKSEILRRIRMPAYRSSPGCKSPVCDSKKDRPTSAYENLSIISSNINDGPQQRSVSVSVHNHRRNETVIDTYKDLAKESNKSNDSPMQKSVADNSHMIIHSVVNTCNDPAKESYITNRNDSICNEMNDYNLNESNNIDLAQHTTILCSGKSTNSMKNDTIPNDDASEIRKDVYPVEGPCQDVNEDKNIALKNVLPTTSTSIKSTSVNLQTSNGSNESVVHSYAGLSNAQQSNLSQPTVDIRSTQADSPTNTCQNSINITIPATITWKPDGGDTGTLTGAAMIDMPLGVAQLQGLFSNISNQKSPSRTQSPTSTPELTQTEPVVFSMTSSDVTQVSRCSPLTTEGNRLEKDAQSSEVIVNEQIDITKPSTGVVSMEHIPDVENCDTRVKTNCNSPRKVTGTALCENFVTSTLTTVGEASTRSDMGSPTPCSSISSHEPITSIPNVSDAELLLAFSQGDNGCKFAETLETKSHKEEEGWRNVWKKKRGGVASAGPHRMAIRNAAPSGGSNGTHTIPVGMAQAAALCVRPPKSTADVKPPYLSR